MIVKIFTASTFGLNAELIECEVDITPALPSIVVVGLPDKAVQESKERVRSAIKQSGYDFPLGKVTINLAPADIYKTGSSFDLPISVAILRLVGYVTKPISDKFLFAGELALNGSLRSITGTLTICLWAKKNGFKKVFVPQSNAKEAALVKDLEVIGVDNLEDLVDYLNGQKNLPIIETLDLTKIFEEEEFLSQKTQNNHLYINDLAYVRGQAVAKRALEIAASGGHNILFIGQPGSGKTLLARSYPTILPKMTEQEILEVTQIYSLSGLLKDGKILTKRPFRSPHHSSSHIALVGGGTKLRPGEISLAHRGVLFLDEFPEFTRETIEALRQPLEDGFITISRAKGSVEYPSRFYLLAAANPTPNGFDIDDPDGFNKPQNRAAIARYQAKFSGPILDRIDLQVEVNRPAKDELQTQKLAEPSKIVAKRVQNARTIQTQRFAHEKIFTNSEMSLPLIEKYCQLDEQTQNILSKAIDKFKLSARSYIRTLKLSRTIADLDNSQNIQSKHLAESLQYRGKWG
jgi:magnesium chelatase family protein